MDINDLSSKCYHLLAGLSNNILLGDKDSVKYYYHESIKTFNLLCKVANKGNYSTHYLKGAKSDLDKYKKDNKIIHVALAMYSIQSFVAYIPSLKMFN